MTLKEHTRLFWRSRNGTNLSDVKFLSSYLKLFLREGSYGNPQENQVSGICILSPTVWSIKPSATTNFSLERKKEWADKTRNILFYV